MLNNGNINSITIINYLYFCLSVNRAIQQRVYEILSFFDLQKSLLNYLEPRTFIFKEENSNSYLVCNFGRFGS